MWLALCNYLYRLYYRKCQRFVLRWGLYYCSLSQQCALRLILCKRRVPYSLTMHENLPHLYVGPSSQPHAGDGLFTRTSIARGTIIMPIPFETLGQFSKINDGALLLADQHLPATQILENQHLPATPGRRVWTLPQLLWIYLQYHIQSDRVNTQVVLDSCGNAWLRALREIPAETELLRYYGFPAILAILSKLGCPEQLLTELTATLHLSETCYSRCLTHLYFLNAQGLDRHSHMYYQRIAKLH